MAQKKETDYVYRIYEMTDAIEESVANIEKVIGEQKLLVETISASPQAEHFKDFIKETNEQTENLSKQIPVLNKRIDCLRTVVSLADDKRTKDIINCLFEGLGIDLPETK